MLRSLFNGLKSSRTALRSRRPSMEPLEGRKLLATVPLMTFNGTTVVEGNDVAPAATFTVVLTSPTTTTVTVDYSTVDNTARAGSDYVATSGRLTFAPGETQKAVSVPIIADTAIEPLETFRLRLSNARNAILIKSLSDAVIQDDDTPITPELSIGGVSMTRGLSGYKLMTFTVSLNTAVSTPVSVTAATRNLTAIAGSDYEANRQTLTFAPGEKTKEFTVKIFGTSTPGPDELLYVDLSGANVALKVRATTGILRYGA